MSTNFYKIFSPAIYPMFRSVWVFMQISTYVIRFCCNLFKVDPHFGLKGQDYRRLQQST